MYTVFQIVSVFLLLYSLSSRCQNISVFDADSNSTWPFRLVTVIVKVPVNISFTNVNQVIIVTTTPPPFTLATPEEEFWLRTVLLIPSWVDVNTTQFRNDVQQKLVKVVELAVERQQSKRYQLPDDDRQQNAINDKVLVQVLNISRDGTSNRVTVIYAVKLNGYYVGANALNEDLKLIGNSEFSAYMGYPVQQVKSYVIPAQQEKQNWWIIGAVIGSTVGVLLCGWCLLFVYYNTCGRAFHPDIELNKTIAEHSDKPSSPATKKANSEDETRKKSSESNKIYLISTDVQTDAPEDEEVMKATQPTNWVVPFASSNSQKPLQVHRQSSLPSSTSVDVNQGMSQQNHQIHRPSIVLPNNSFSHSTSQRNIHRKGSFVNSMNSPPSKSESGTLKTNEEIQTIGISVDQEQKSIDQKFTMEQVTLGGVSGIINSGSSMDQTYSTVGNRNVAASRVEDIWTLYPFQRYQAADNVHRLTATLSSDHPRPSPSSTVGEILMHSSQFKPKRLEPVELSKVFGLI